MFYEEQTLDYKYSTGFIPSVCDYHIHRHVEIVYVERGELGVNIGGKDYSMHEGEMAVIFPYIPHGYSVLPHDHMEDMRENNLSHTMLCELDLLPLQSEFLLGNSPKDPVISAGQVHEDVLYAEKRLAGITYSEHERALIGALFSLCLIQLLSQMELTTQRDSSAMDLISPIFRYIDEHYQENLSLSSVSKEFGMGKYQLSRLFNTVLNISFTTHINSLRINRAKELLLSSPLSITSIALECGYQNQQTFNRIFREYCDCTPSEFRKYGKSGPWREENMA